MAKYIMKISNGVCYPFDTHKHLQDAAGYKVITDGEDAPVVEQPKRAAPVEQKLPDVKDVKLQKIVDAVRGIPAERYNKGRFGRPAMPDVDEVSAAVGEKVTAAEVADAMKVIGG